MGRAGRIAAACGGHLPPVVTGTLFSCASTFPKSASNHGLLVANRTYALTAGNCVQCSCAPGNLNLYCTPASLSGSCPSTQCSHSNVSLGNSSIHPTSAGYNVSCSYGGFINGTITTLLNTDLQPKCPAPHQLSLLTDPPTTVNHNSTHLPPLSAPAPAEAGGVIPEPGEAAGAIPPPSSSEQGGSFTPPKTSPADGPTGSVSTAPLMSRPHQILSGFIFCLLLHLHM